MKHLSPERFLELGLAPSCEPSPEEAAHLDSCSTCARELASERALTASLEQLPRAKAPHGFVEATSARFAETLARRRLHRAAWGMLAALFAGYLAIAGIVGVALLNAGKLVHSLALAVEELVALGHAAFVVMSKLPAVPLTLTALVCASALVFSSLLGRLARATAEAK